MAVSKEQKREKPAKREQRKVQGPEWEPQLKQTALLDSPIYTGQAQGEKKHIKRGAMYSPSWSPLPPPSLLNPSGSTRSLWVFPVHQARAHVSCIPPGLVICFTLDNIHVSMLFSWNIPPSPSPTESKSLFYTSVSLFLFCIYIADSCQCMAKTTIIL